MRFLQPALLFALLFSCLDLFAETPPIQVESFQVDHATLPGGKKPWTKLICTFNNSAEWADGISFNFTVLVEAGGTKNRKVLTGGATYFNIPKGESQAILYLSPNAAARFGDPIAATIEVDRGERTIQTFQWAGSAGNETGWLAKYPMQNGALLGLHSTPWLLYDSEVGGDLLTN